MSWDGYSIFMVIIVGAIFYWFIIVCYYSAQNNTQSKKLSAQIVTFRMHLTFMLLLSVCLFLRPFWKVDLNDTIYNNPTLCDIYARFKVFCITSVIFPVYFSYWKTRFYREILPSNNLEHFALMWASHIGFILMTLAIIFANPGASELNGIKECFWWNQSLIVLNSLLGTWMMVMYIWIISIFSRNHDGLEALMVSIPQLRPHIAINRWFCLFIFATTLALLQAQSQGKEYRFDYCFFNYAFILYRRNFWFLKLKNS